MQFSLTRSFLYKNRIVGFALKRKNKGERKPVFWYILRSESLNHSHKKRKDSLEGSLDRVLFAAELDFPKILVPR